MNGNSIPQLRTHVQKRTGAPLEGWESYFFQRGCRLAQEEARAWLEELDEQLLEVKPQGWRVVGKRSRTLVTRFGPVTFERRLYRDERGGYHVLLDEVLGLPAYQAASEEVMESVMMLVTGMPFAWVSEVLVRLTAGVLSPSTVWRLVQGVGRRVVEAEEVEVKRVFGQGAPPRRVGQRQARRLYVEADGVVIRQRTGTGRARWKEVRLGVAYDERGKERVYLHGGEKVNFWEGASLEWGAEWDWSQVEEVVVNGDDASWIDEASEVLAGVVRQLDRFHVVRAAYRAIGAEAGRALSDALQAGDGQQVRKIWQHVPKPGKEAPKKQREAWDWLARHLEDPRMVRWWHRVGEPEGDVETLGHIESLVGAIVAHRMKGKRRHWSARGKQHMVKVLQVVHNGDVASWCGRYQQTQDTPPQYTKSRHPRLSRDPGAWLQARLPFLQGPFPTDPYLLRLREMIRLPN